MSARHMLRFSTLPRKYQRVWLAVASPLRLETGKEANCLRIGSWVFTSAGSQRASHGFYDRGGEAERDDNSLWSE